MKIENIIKNRGREQFYNYYLSLGYDNKTAAALALFTYGDYRYETFSIDDLYYALCKGEEYLPQEVIEERKRLEEEFRRRSKSRKGRGIAYGFSDGTASSCDFGGAFGGIAKCITVDELDASEENFDQLFDSNDALADSADYDVPEFLYSAEPTEAVKSMRSPSVRYTDAMGLAGALGYATDEYEQIEEKDARSTVAEPTSTFRMTTNTASAGVILNQLRNGRRIDRSMVRIEEMLNYFRYNSTIPEDGMFSISSELLPSIMKSLYL